MIMPGFKLFLLSPTMFPAELKNVSEGTFVLPARIDIILDCLTLYAETTLVMTKAVKDPAFIYIYIYKASLFFFKNT